MVYEQVQIIYDLPNSITANPYYTCNINKNQNCYLLPLSLCMKPGLHLHHRFGDINGIVAKLFAL